jgi:hypothetical protein
MNFLIFVALFVGSLAVCAGYYLGPSASIEQQPKSKALVFIAAFVLSLAWLVFALGAHRPGHETGADHFGRGMILMISVGISLFANVICVAGLIIGRRRLAFLVGLVFSPSAWFLWAGFFGGHNGGYPGP